MQSVDFISRANSEMFGMVKELFSLGIALEAVGDINPMGIEANQLISSITRDDSLTSVNIVIRGNVNLLGLLQYWGA